MIWTGSLNFTYNQHYSQRKGWPNNTQPGAGEKEGVRCLSLGSHIQFYQLRWNHSNRLLLSVLCCGISTQYPFSHLPSLGLSQNFPISTNQKNLDEFHKKGQGSYFYSNALGFFPQEKALCNLQRHKFTNPAHIACHLEEWTGTSRVWGRASYTEPEEESSEKGRKIMLPIHYSMGYKRQARWEEILHSSPRKRCKGKQNPIDIGIAVENERRFRTASIRKMHVILEPKCHRRLQSCWRHD